MEFDILIMIENTTIMNTSKILHEKWLHLIHPSQLIQMDPKCIPKTENAAQAIMLIRSEMNKVFFLFSFSIPEYTNKYVINSAKPIEKPR